MFSHPSLLTRWGGKREQVTIVATSGFIDGSNDHKYFTMIPHCVLDELDANEQSLYMQVKRYAGEKGTAYPSHSSLMEKMDISRNTLKKCISNLCAKGFIEQIGLRKIKTIGGTQKVKEYRIIDIWGRNNSYYYSKYKGVSKNDIPMAKGVSKTYAKGCQNSAPNKNHINKKEISNEIRGTEEMNNILNKYNPKKNGIHKS